MRRVLFGLSVNGTQHRRKDGSENGGISLQFIQPGKPQQNAYVERYNRTVRYDWLNQYIFETIEDVQQAATE